MAKSGEGDPRWIIEDRKDYANVNNWHWIERDVTAWSIDKIKTILLNLKINTTNVSWNVNHVSCDGMATVNVRKGVLKYIVDFELELDIDGMPSKGEKELKGKIAIHEFDFDNASKLNYEITVDDDSGDRSTTIKHLKDACPCTIGLSLKEFIQALVQECSKGLIIPLNETDTPQKPEVHSTAKQSTSTSHASVKTEQKKAAPISKKLFTLDHEFSCTVSDLYDIFVNDKKISALSNSATILKPIVSEKFSFLNGSVSGKFFEIIKDNKLVMSWRFTDWPADYYSLVTLVFTSTSSGARISLSHDEVPEYDIERVKIGWDRYFFQPIVRVFGYGSESITSQLF